MKNRLADIAKTNTMIGVSIIFSSEPNFMQNWLINNSMTGAENIFRDNWKKLFVRKNTINLKEFTYFAYTFNYKISK